MAAVSKVANPEIILKGYHCKTLVHPWTNSCILSACDNALQAVIGTSQIALAIYLIPIILKRQKPDRDQLRQTCKKFARTVGFGTTMTFGVFYTHCFLRNLLGDYYHTTPVAIPSLVGSLAIFVESPTRRTTTLFAFFNIMLDCLLYKSQNRMGVHLSTTQLTASFMLFSGALLYLLRCPRYRKHVSPYGLWFFVPPKVDTLRQSSENEPMCPHNGGCVSNIIKESGKLLCAGLAIQYLRVLFYHARSGPRVFVRQLTLKKNYMLALFLGSYVATYQVVSCLLCRLRGHDSELHAIPAGVLAATMFHMQPDKYIGFSALTTIIQVFVSLLVDELHVTNLTVLQGLVFTGCASFLFNTYFVDPSVIPRMLRDMMERATMGRVKSLQNILLTCQKKWHLKQLPVMLAGI